MTVTVPKVRGAPTAVESPFGLHNLYEMFVGITVPDPITFVVGQQWLNRPNLYPRQATLLKIIFLRDDLFTLYDLEVIEEWESDFRRTGNSGIVPNILARITILKAQGYRWFREVLFVMGRRAGKGHVTALAMAYVLWCYMSRGDVQGFYGIDRDKRLTALIFAGKRDQAKATVFADLVNIIVGSECFAPYISSPQTERLSIYAPYDFVRMQRLAQRGVVSARDMATFEILPKESTGMAGRGSSVFMAAFDEFAHVVAATSSASSEAVYTSTKPSLDQFGRDAFIVEPSSPWQMTGQFYKNYTEALATDEDGNPVRANYLVVQLASWAIYLDWERAQWLALFPDDFEGDLGEYADLDESPRFQPLRGAIQTYDDEMRREKAANPETFAVEREAHFATALDAYLNDEKVREIFAPWLERPAHYGPPQIVTQQQGLLIHSYKGHADPSKVNDKFGYALAHTETDAQGRANAVFDVIGHFDPADYPDHILDYEEVDDWLWFHLITKFYPDEFTFDQYNSVASIQKLQKRVRNTPMPKHINVFEKTSTKPYDWTVKENSKAAINLGLVHAPVNDRGELELRFLQLVNGRVDHPSVGPVQSKDIADCYDRSMEVLTERGWMLFKDVPRGLRVATRSPDGRLEYQEPTAYIERQHTGVLYEHRSNRLNFSVTPGHRMLVTTQDGNERFVRAEDMTSQRYLIPKTSVVEDRVPNVIRLDDEDVSAALVRTVGRGGSRKGLGWTQDQDDYLTVNYSTASMADLCSVLGKSRSAIYKRAAVTGLVRGQIGDRIGDRPKSLPETKVEDFAAFLGIWLAEGRKMRDKPGYDVKITQTKPDAVEWIDALFSRLPWPVKRTVQANGETVWVVKSHGLREYLRACQGDGHELLIPDEVFSTWSRREMEQLLEGLLVGDGVWSGQQQRHVGYYSTSKRLVDDVQRLLLHVGLTSGAAKVVQRTSQYKANHDLWYVGVNVSRTAVLNTDRIERVPYDGMVYCLTVPNGTLLVRRERVPMWAGNCMTECIHVLIGEQVQNFLHSDLNNLRPGMTTMGGEPFPEMSRGGNQSDRDLMSQMSGFSRARGHMEGGDSPSRARRRRY